MRQNILYITKQNTWIYHELEVVKVNYEGKTIFQVPIHHLEGITLFGVVSMSPSLMNKALERGVSVSWLTEWGKFLGRVEGISSGNVLLRREQFRKADDPAFRLALSKRFVAGKIRNTRLNLLRSAREITDTDKSPLEYALKEMAKILEKLEFADSENSVRGLEGISAKYYYDNFNVMIRQQKDDFYFDGRNRRPPKDRVNALLSFFYALMTNECISALQSVGLDPYVGYLHCERPGRPSLALDIMEEFRSFSDRVTLSIINLKQITKNDFLEKPGSIFFLTDEMRKEVLKIWQTKKQDEIHHELLNRKCRIADLPHIQARILARTIRGDLKEYQPFLWR
ncbi:type I-C CRISPR-associated endonuclease Cas1 [bacterium]|nr:type I-C CRISPR-associated endonuclease Cas1 [bacterium]MCP5463055.1 type I-C CRISPR-associated endonuclease Cas1 [bacterium]